MYTGSGVMALVCVYVGELTIAPVKIFQISLCTNSVWTSLQVFTPSNFISQPLSLTQPYLTSYKVKSKLWLTQKLVIGMSPLSLELPFTNTVFSLLNSTEHTKINLGRKETYLLKKKVHRIILIKKSFKLDYFTCSLSEAHTVRGRERVC